METTPLRGPYSKDELFRLRFQDPALALRTYRLGLCGEFGPVPKAMVEMAGTALAKLEEATSQWQGFRRCVCRYGEGQHCN